MPACGPGILLLEAIDFLVPGHDAVAPKDTVCWKAADQLVRRTRGVGGNDFAVPHNAIAPTSPGGAWPVGEV